MSEWNQSPEIIAFAFNFIFCFLRNNNYIHWVLLLHEQCREAEREHAVDSVNSGCLHGFCGIDNFLALDLYASFYKSEHINRHSAHSQS